MQAEFDCDYATVHVDHFADYLTSWESCSLVTGRPCVGFSSCDECCSQDVAALEDFVGPFKVPLQDGVGNDCDIIDVHVELYGLRPHVGKLHDEVCMEYDAELTACKHALKGTTSVVADSRPPKSAGRSKYLMLTHDRLDEGMFTVVCPRMQKGVAVLDAKWDGAYSVEAPDLFQYSRSLFFGQKFRRKVFRHDGVVLPLPSKLSFRSELQRKAFEHVCVSSPISVLQGMPGFGKTWLVGSYMLAAVLARAQNDLPLLYTCHTNASLASASSDMTELAGVCGMKVRAYIASSEPSMVERFAGKLWTPEIGQAFDVLFCTAGTRRRTMLSNLQFSTVVLEEASAMPCALYPLVCYNALRLVVIGDQHQVEPVCHAASSKRSCLFVSVLDGLIKAGAPTFLVNETTRIPQCALPLFVETYGAGLSCTVDRRFDLIAYTCPGEAKRSSTSWYNVEEAELIVRIIELFCTENRSDTIVVMTPYVAQQSLVLRLLNESPYDLKDIQVLMERSLPGLTVDVSVMSTVRSLSCTSDASVLADYRGLNVKLSRAKHACVVIADPSYVNATIHFRAMGPGGVPPKAGSMQDQADNAFFHACMNRKPLIESTSCVSYLRNIATSADVIASTTDPESVNPFGRARYIMRKFIGARRLN